MKLEQRDTDLEGAQCEGVEAQPPLLLLTDDASSLSARRLLSFPDAESAARHIEFWFAPDAFSGISALWALPAPPTDEAAEAVVLIRHPRTLGLVYPFSFASMEQALEAVREEMRHGLGIGHVAIYYAVQVSFRAGHDGCAIATPVTPPHPQQPAPTARRSAAIPAPIFVVEESFLSRAFNAVRLRRWMPRPAPFAGFGSPPGRF